VGEEGGGGGEEGGGDGEEVAVSAASMGEESGARCRMYSRCKVASGDHAQYKVG
jgi:hypothetical protein